jgi:hypothetical protein
VSCVLQLEFAAAYHRLCGKRVLFGQGFHCTGMPIKVRPATYLVCVEGKVRAATDVRGLLRL